LSLVTNCNKNFKIPSTSLLWSRRDGSNPFDGLMGPPRGCVQHWRVNRDYISDLESNDDGTTLFASLGDGTLSVFDVRYVGRKGTSRSVVAAVDDRPPQQRDNKRTTTWETSGYS
jgi:hypothetical protein